MPRIQAAFRKTEITPSAPVHLAGYFNRRLSRGVLDPLFLRLAVLRFEGRTLAFIAIDTCAVLREDADEIRDRVAGAGVARREDVMVFATHLHTAPDIVGLFGLPRETEYLARLKDRIIEDLRALEPAENVEVSIAKTLRPGLASNRRWFLKDGRVMTNPPKLSAELDRPEGPVDDEVNTVAFRDEAGRIRALFVNISNHTDTIGGFGISADWPGVMERRLNETTSAEFPVLTFIAPQGNINHFDFLSGRGQTGPEEARRLGLAYAEAVAGSLGGLRPVRVEVLEGREIDLPLEPLGVAEEEVVAARRLLGEGNAESAAASSRELTAEDLAAGDEAVRRLFAAGLLEFRERGPSVYRLPLQVLKVGRIAFAAVPGEPFVEVGLALKRIEGYDLIVPTALANGYFGYIPLAENFGRGGYETQPGTSSRLSRHAADKILDALQGLLRG
jgi:neutral ceramidase